jgi:GT2 family glycosyltransferase
MVSIFVAVMNRNDRMRETLSNWLQYDWFDEIVVVDWSSDIPFEFDHPKVKVFRVEGEPKWVLSQSFNLAASLTKGDILVKMDADYRVRDHFANIFPIPQGTYYHGTWLGLWNIHAYVDGNPRYLNGFVACHRKAFEDVNGYNERITSYGWDDTDLYQRLDKVATPLIIAPETGIWHEPHDDELRTVNQNPNTVPGKDWEGNKEISESNPWSIHDTKVQWVRDGHTFRQHNEN